VLDTKKDYLRPPKPSSNREPLLPGADLDPKGWFWAPADAVKDEYVLADASHYGRVMPEVMADGFVTGRLAN